MREPQFDSWSAAMNPALILRYTRHWIHYGSISFVTLVILVSAFLGLTGR